MTFRHWTLAIAPAGVGALVIAGLLQQAPATTVVPDRLPEALSNQEFWSLVEHLSEPDGFFRSNSGSPDNLLSNENMVSTVAAALAGEVPPGGVYLGVGPEQNFSYIAAMRPRMAFIVDIRRGNLHLHLLYKAIFEMSADRADFVARLFGRRRPPNLDATVTADRLMTVYLAEDPIDEVTFKRQLQSVVDHLTRTRQLPLAAEDLTGIEYVSRNFHRFGPAIHYTSSIGRTSGPITYARLMAATDRASGRERTYLASESHFALVKGLHNRNLLVPVVGDFAGPKALRSIGAFLKDRGADVTAFYVSNVEMYLHRNGVWAAFCANAGALPVNRSSVFIRPDGRAGTFTSIAAETARCGSTRPGR